MRVPFHCLRDRRMSRKFLCQILVENTADLSGSETNRQIITTGRASSGTPVRSSSMGNCFGQNPYEWYLQVAAAYLRHSLHGAVADKDLSDETIFRKTCHQISVAAVFDSNRVAGGGSDRGVATGGFQLDDVLSSGQFQTQNLDSIRQQSPTASVG
jgi:hypothetical protein